MAAMMANASPGGCLRQPDRQKLNGLPKHIVYGYATTIHKSQGGEYQHLIAIVPKNLELHIRQGGFIYCGNSRPPDLNHYRRFR